MCIKMSNGTEELVKVSLLRGNHFFILIFSSSDVYFHIPK